MKPLHTRALAALVSLALGAASASAEAGVMDFLFGKKSSDSNATVTPDKSRKTWRLSEFTAVQIVPREAGSTPNSHPAMLQAKACASSSRWCRRASTTSFSRSSGAKS